MGKETQTGINMSMSGSHQYSQCTAAAATATKCTPPYFHSTPVERYSGHRISALLPIWKANVISGTCTQFRLRFVLRTNGHGAHAAAKSGVKPELSLTPTSGKLVQESISLTPAETQRRCPPEDGPIIVCQRLNSCL